MPDVLRSGLVGEAQTTVDESNVASAYASGHVDVYATPAMIGLMEHASINAVDHLLPDGSVSVGARIDVQHLAATPPGLQVRARAEVLRVDGRKLTFRVEAFDAVEKVGEGTHERIVVDLARLMARAEAKRPST